MSLRLTFVSDDDGDKSDTDSDKSGGSKLDDGRLDLSALLG